MEDAAIRLPPYTGGPQQDPSIGVPESLLASLKAQFPNVVPPEFPGEDPVMTLGKARGRQEVIAYLERLHLEQQEK
jgi:hypothetical protein